MTLRRLTAALQVCFLSACTPAIAQRLPSTAIPEHYDLSFDVDLAKARFDGVETIRLRLTAPSRRIVLHALDITFQEVTVSAGGSTQTAKVALDLPTQTAALTVAQAVPAGPAEIRVRYTGILNDKLRGFYLSKANGRNYAVTQFESTDARRAFPSFDEPAYKATFTLALTIDERDTAISNGRLLSDTPGPGAGRHTLRFAETPKMSSYLVAMAVGDFQCVSGEADSIPIRICATPDKRELGHVALEAAQPILSFYNRYYSIKYPFTKLDIVAVPDFAAGAMENTAAIFYREADLLADARTASVNDVKRIWSVLAHEIAHMWFGDLVTMQWWDDLWLNEGFATWMEKRPLAALKPEWKMDVEEAGDTQSAMNRDAQSSTRAVRSAVETPDEIEGSFDTIAYEKGGSLMGMLEGYLGPETFRRGVNAYVERHAYGTATSADFWTAMTAASGRPIDQILPGFVNQSGVPILQTSLRCVEGRSQLTFATERFSTASGPARLASRAADWQVPICVKTPASDAVSCQIVKGANARIELEPNQCVPWAFVNAGAKGYFRTAYSPNMLAALAPEIPTRLTEAERHVLIGDEWALVQAGRHTVGDYLTLASGFGNEHASGVLEEVTTRLQFAGDYLTTNETRPAFERFVQAIFSPLLTELGVQAPAGAREVDDRLALRSTVVDLVGNVGNDRRVPATARTVLDRALSGQGALEATAARTIIRTAARNGDQQLWDRLLKASRDASSPGERYRYLYALGAFEDPALADRGLNLTLTPEVRSQDTSLYLSRFLENPVTRPRAWAFVKQHWTELAPKITIAGADSTLLRSLSSFCDLSARDDIRAFFTTHKLPAASRAFDQTLERISNCVAIKDKQAPALGAWLAKR